MPECLTCKEEFVDKHHKKGRNPKFCSVNCFRLRKGGNPPKNCKSCGKQFSSKNKPQLACSRSCGGREFITPEKFWGNAKRDSMGCLIYTKDSHIAYSDNSPYNVNHYAFELLFKRKPVGFVYRICKNNYCLIHLEDKIMRESRPKPLKRIKLFDVFINCEHCERQYLVDGAHYRYKIKINQKFYCSRSCAKKVRVPGWRKLYSRVK